MHYTREVPTPTAYPGYAAGVDDVDDFSSAPQDVARMGQLLRDGGLVAFPTETVYGLGANALDATAVARIFAAKERPSFNPLIVHIADRAHIAHVATEFSPLAKQLADAFWPGPLSLVLPRAEAIPDIVTGGLETVGIRMPAHPLALALIRAAGVPLAAPSANRFTQVSPTTAEHVRAALGERVDAILDGGPTKVGIESTIVAVAGDRATLLRTGGISRNAIEQITGSLADAAPEAEGDTRRSPGRIERHYAPNTPLFALKRTGAGHQLEWPPAFAGSDASAVVVSTGPLVGDLPACATGIEMPDDAASYARLLYAALHRADACDAAFVLWEIPPTGSEWEAVHDRLRRAGLPTSKP
ncbi:MAG: L-threonylcarbamoyladenylate synthase [Planctomycetota bacterium]